MRYIVTRTLEEVDGPGLDGPGLTIHQPPVLCETDVEVREAIAEVTAHTDRDFSLWEVVDGRCVSRSITHLHDRMEIG